MKTLTSKTDDEVAYAIRRMEERESKNPLASYYGAIGTPVPFMVSLIS